MNKIACSIFFIIAFTSIKGQTWNSVGGGANKQIQKSVASLFTHQDTLLLGGSFDTLGNIFAQNIGRWDGTDFSAMSSFNNKILDYIIWNNDLYVCGEFTKINGTNDCKFIARHNGSGWDSLSAQLNLNVRCLSVYQGKLYAGGHFYATGGNNLNRVAYWDGSQWNSLGTGINGGLPIVRCMTVYKNELYIGGNFTNGNGIISYNIIKWNGSNFSSVAGGTDGMVNCMIVDTNSNLLIVGGGFNSAGGDSTPSNIASWDGSVWAPLGNGPVGLGTALNPYSLEFYNGFLYACGPLDQAVNANGDTLKFIAKWDGINWLPLGKGLESTGLALEVYKGELYVGGFFHAAGDCTAYKIARWYEPPLGEEELKSEKDEFLIYPNPSGNFWSVHCPEPGTSEYSVFDKSGKEIIQRHFETPSRHFTVPSEEYTPGIYFLKLMHGDKSITKRLLKQ